MAPPRKRKRTLSKTVAKSTNEYHCQTSVKLEKIHFVWQIDHFQFAYHQHLSDSKSPGFSTKSDKHMVWKLQLNTSYNEENLKDYIGLFLYLDSGYEGEGVSCKFKLAILDSDLDAKIIFSTKTNVNFTKNEHEWGWFKFVKRDFLFDEGNDMLPGDQLTITCDLEYMCISSENVVHNITKNFNPVHSIDVPECNIIEDLRHLWLNGNLSDVTLSVNGKKFPAHKVILTARSSVFAAMFKHKMKESNSSRVEIEDIDEQVFKELLRYIYTGKVNNLENVVYDLLAAANKYDLERLKIICEANLCKQLKVENAVKILILADMHNSKQLKERAIDFIETHLRDVMNTCSWKDMISSHPYLINEVFCSFAINNK